MANQVDLPPATPGNTTGLHVHVPAGQSANVITNPTDNPFLAKNGVQTTVTGNDEVPSRICVSGIS